MCRDVSSSNVSRCSSSSSDSRSLSWCSSAGTTHLGRSGAVRSNRTLLETLGATYPAHTRVRTATSTPTIAERTSPRRSTTPHDSLRRGVPPRRWQRFSSPRTRCSARGTSTGPSPPHPTPTMAEILVAADEVQRAAGLLQSRRPRNAPRPRRREARRGRPGEPRAVRVVEAASASAPAARAQQAPRSRRHHPTNTPSPAPTIRRPTSGASAEPRSQSWRATVGRTPGSKRGHGGRQREACQAGLARSPWSHDSRRPARTTRRSSPTTTTSTTLARTAVRSSPASKRRVSRSRYRSANSSPGEGTAGRRGDRPGLDGQPFAPRTDHGPCVHAGGRRLLLHAGGTLMVRCVIDLAASE